MTNLINIVSLGHSGSTLLAMCLNSHPEISFFGEFGSIAKRIHKTDGFKICSFCNNSNCPVFDVNEINIIKKYYSHGKFYSKYFNFISHYFYLKHFYNKNNTKFIGDSSKSPEWFLSNLFVYKNFINSFYVIIEREKYGVANSFLKKNKSLKDTIKYIKTETDSINKLVSKLNKKKYIKIKYEDFIGNPKLTLTKIMDIIGFDFNENLLQYRSIKHHFIGGNAGTMTLANKPNVSEKKNISWYKKIQNDFEIDYTWKKELSIEQIDQIKKELY